MSKEFSNKIKLCPVDQLPDIIESPFDDFDLLHSNIDIDPDVNPGLSPAGRYYQFSLRTVISELYSETVKKYENRRPLVLIIFDTNGGFYQVGDQIIPVRCLITPVKFVYEMNFSGTLLESPF